MRYPLKRPGKGLFKSMKSLLDYLTGVRMELSHVKWPSVPQAIGYTALVIFISLVVAALIGGLDFSFTFIIEQVVQRF